MPTRRWSPRQACSSPPTNPWTPYDGPVLAPPGVVPGGCGPVSPGGAPPPRRPSDAGSPRRAAGPRPRQRGLPGGAAHALTSPRWGSAPARSPLPRDHHHPQVPGRWQPRAARTSPTETIGGARSYAGERPSTTHPPVETIPTHDRVAVAALDQDRLRRGRHQIPDHLRPAWPAQETDRHPLHPLQRIALDPHVRNGLPGQHNAPTGLIRDRIPTDPMVGPGGNLNTLVLLDVVLRIIVMNPIIADDIPRRAMPRTIVELDTRPGIGKHLVVLDDIRIAIEVDAMAHKGSNVRRVAIVVNLHATNGVVMGFHLWPAPENRHPIHPRIATLAPLPPHIHDTTPPV